jgi:hypothetical protein
LVRAAIVPQAGQLSSLVGTVSPQFLQFIPSSLLATQASAGLRECGLDLSRAYTKDQKRLSAQNLREMRLEV